MEKDRFGILDISPKDLPAFAFSEALILRRNEAGKAQRVRMPAGTGMVLFTTLYTREGQGGRRFVELWEPLDASRIRRLGDLPLDNLEARQGYEGEQAVRRWIASRRYGYTEK